MIIDRYIDGVAPFGNVRVKARLAARRTLSWPTPSFFANMSLGIRLVPSVAYRIFSHNSVLSNLITYFYVSYFYVSFYSLTLQSYSEFSE